MNAKMIKTEAPKKGDLVVGHKVYAFFHDLPAVPANVVAVSKSGHEVTIQIDRMLAILGASKVRWDFTWRTSAKAYQPKGEPTRKGCGLALVR